MPRKSSKARRKSATKAVVPPPAPLQEHTVTEPSAIETVPHEQPLPEVRPMVYHAQVLDYLQQHETQLWHWFASHQTQQQAFETAKVELLKAAYRLDRESAAELYQLADAVLSRMQLCVPVTLYIAQQSSGLNASLTWLPDAAHIVLHGGVQDTLSAAELSAVLAHELAHHELLSLQDGAFLVAEQLLAAMLADPAADVPHERTWRCWRLYTELHCDRRAAQATGDMDACVRALVKLETGLKSVSAESYLQQAAEVLAGGPQTSEGVTHPEMFIRAHALQLWHTDPDAVDHQLQAMIEGPLQLGQLDLLSQRRMVQLTQDLVAQYLKPPWLQTELMLSHARRFSEDAADVRSFLKAKWNAVVSGDSSASENAAADLHVANLKLNLQQCDSELRKYFCYVLLDFVTCDFELEEGPLAAAFSLTEQLGLLEEFRHLSAQELKLGKRTLQKIEATYADLMQLAAQEASSEAR